MNLELTNAPYNHYLAVDADTRSMIDVWCKENITGPWCSASYYPGYGATPPTWYFERKEDHLLFILRWS